MANAQLQLQSDAMRAAATAAGALTEFASEGQLLVGIAWTTTPASEMGQAAGRVEADADTTRRGRCSGRQSGRTATSRVSDWSTAARSADLSLRSDRHAAAVPLSAFCPGRVRVCRLRALSTCCHGRELEWRLVVIHLDHLRRLRRAAEFLAELSRHGGAATAEQSDHGQRRQGEEGGCIRAKEKSEVRHQAIATMGERKGATQRRKGLRGKRKRCDHCLSRSTTKQMASLRSHEHVVATLVEW